MARGLFGNSSCAAAQEDLSLSDAIYLDVTVEEISNLDQLNDKITNYSIAADELNEMQTIAAEAIKKNNGLDRVSAELINLSINSIQKKLNIKEVKTSLPSVEAFSSITSRKQATIIAVEKIGDDIKKIVDAVIKFFKEMWEKLVSFFKRNKNNTDALKKETALLKREIFEENLEGEPLSEVRDDIVHIVNEVKEGVVDRKKQLKRINLVVKTSVNNKFDQQNKSSSVVVSDASDKAIEHLEESGEVIAEAASTLSTIFALYEKDTDPTLKESLTTTDNILDINKSLYTVSEESERLHGKLTNILTEVTKGDPTNDKRTNIQELKNVMGHVSKIGTEAVKQQNINNEKAKILLRLQRKNLNRLRKKKKLTKH